MGMGVESGSPGTVSAGRGSQRDLPRISGWRQAVTRPRRGGPPHPQLRARSPCSGCERILRGSGGFRYWSGSRFRIAGAAPGRVSSRRPASPTSIPSPLPRPRARESERARARAPRCARAPAGRRPQATSGARLDPAGGGCGGARHSSPASESRPRPAACPAARLAEAGQVRIRCRGWCLPKRRAEWAAPPSGAHCSLHPALASPDKPEILKLACRLPSPGALRKLLKSGPHTVSGGWNLGIIIFLKFAS